MWTAPVPQEFFRRFDRIACVHMSGVDAVTLDRWPRWFPRRELQTTTRPSSANGSHGLSRTSDRSILPSALLLQLRLSRCGETRRPADLSSGECRCAKHPRAVVTLARRHQLPADAGNLVGECHGREFGRL